MQCPTCGQCRPIAWVNGPGLTQHQLFLCSRTWTLLQALLKVGVRAVIAPEPGLAPSQLDALPRFLTTALSAALGPSPGQPHTHGHSHHNSSLHSNHHSQQAQLGTLPGSGLVPSPRPAAIPGHVPGSARRVGGGPSGQAAGEPLSAALQAAELACPGLDGAFVCYHL